LIDLSTNDKLQLNFIKLLKHFFIATATFSSLVQNPQNLKMEITNFYKKVQKNLRATPQGSTLLTYLLVCLYNILQEKKSIKDDFFLSETLIINEILESLTERCPGYKRPSEHIGTLGKSLLKFLNNSLETCGKNESLKRIFLEIWDNILQEEKIVEYLIENPEFLKIIFLSSNLANNFIIFELFIEYCYKAVSFRYFNPPFYRQCLLNYISDIFYESILSSEVTENFSKIRVKINQVQVLLKFFQDLILGGDRPYSLSNFSADRSENERLEDNRHIHFSSEVRMKTKFLFIYLKKKNQMDFVRLEVF
jgi:hypothetical protein